MSIRNFAVIPCATCGRDTVHLVLKCRECGTVHLSNYEARGAAVRRLLDGVRNPDGRRAYIKARRLQVRKMREQRLVIPEGSLDSRR